MTFKKKKKTAINAIDKYLMQKRYSHGKKDETNEDHTNKIIQVVVPKVSESCKIYSTNIHTEQISRRSSRSAQTKFSEKKKMINSVEKLKPEKENKKKKPDNLKKLIRTESSILTKNTTRRKLRSARRSIETPNQTKHVGRNLLENQKQLHKNKGKILKNSKKLKIGVQTVKISSNSKSNSEKFVNSSLGDTFKKSSKSRKAPHIAEDTSNKVSNYENCIDNFSECIHSSERNKNLNNSQKNTRNNKDQVTDTLSSIIKTKTNIEKDCKKKPLKNANRPLPRKKRKVTFIEDEPDSPNPADEPSCSYVEVSSSCQDKIDDTEVTEEITPITKKYQPYMERLKLLTSDAIKKFITDNQQYYVDYKKNVESKTMNIPIIGKKMKKHDEMRNHFKCNPFNSDQQLAMYYTLREIFNIPKSHFKECRNFFTILIPEISCQLFAETFRIKVSFAPRLIKKLYPNPVCPV